MRRNTARTKDTFQFEAHTTSDTAHLYNGRVLNMQNTNYAKYDKYRVYARTHAPDGAQRVCLHVYGRCSDVRMRVHTSRNP